MTANPTHTASARCDLIVRLRGSTSRIGDSMMSSVRPSRALGASNLQEKPSFEFDFEYDILFIIPKAFSKEI